MNIQLRKRHRRMWIMVLIFVMVAGHFAWRAVPMNPIAGIPMIACPMGMTNCQILDSNNEYLHSFDAKLLIQDSTTHLNLEITQPIRSAFTLVYWGDSDQPISNSKLLGKVDEMGNYQFDLEIPESNIVHSFFFYDALKKVVLHKINPEL